MASLKGYTTAQHVRDFLGGQVATYLTDTMLDTMISNCEGVVDGWLKVGSGTGSGSLTFSATKSPHLILRDAVTAGAAIKALAASTVSFSTLEQAINARDTAVYVWETSYKLITGDQKPVGIADFIMEQ